MVPVAALLFSLSACAEQTRAPRSGDGARPTIVSLNPCTDAILAEVTQPGQLLAISHYSKDPRSRSMPAALARRFAATGGTAEEVIALRPDVVVGSDFMLPATRAALENAGLRVVTFGITHDVPASLAQVRAMAALAQVPERGEVLARRIMAAVPDSVSGKASAPEAALWQAGGIVPGDGELVSDLLRRSGFASYTGRRGMAQADYLSLEQVLADPPDVLLVAGSERGQRHAALAQLRSTHIASFDAALTWCGGPTIIAAADRLATIRAAVR